MLTYRSGLRFAAMLLLLLGSTEALQCKAAPAPGQPRFDVGVGTHIGLRRDTFANVDPALAELYANSFRDEVLWSRVEVGKGVLRPPPELQEIRRTAAAMKRRSGGRPLIILVYGNPNYDGGKAPHTAEAIDAFARYAAFIAMSLRGAVDRFEIWNEWNRKAGFDTTDHKDGSPEVYASLVRATSRALKTVDPSIEVIVGAVEGIDLNWLDAFGRAGGFNHADAVSLHPYAHHARTGPELSILRTEQSREVIERFATDRPIPILLSEIGWPITRNPSGVTEATGADYVVRGMLMARARPWIRGVWWYNLVDSGRDSTNDEHNFGLLTKDGRRKAGHFAFLAVARLLDELKSVEEMKPPALGVRMLRAVTSAGVCSTIVWSERPDRVTTHRLTARELAQIEIEWVDGAPSPADGPEHRSTFDGIPISGRPIFVRHCGPFSIRSTP